MLTFRRCCIDYSKVYSDVTERWLLAWNQNKHITYYIYISYTNFKILIDILYISTDLLPANKHN